MFPQWTSGIQKMHPKHAAVIWLKRNQFVRVVSRLRPTLQIPAQAETPTVLSCWAAGCQTKIRFFIQLVLGLWAGSFSNISRVWTELFLVRVIWFAMNLCALTMRTHANVKDDRPFSGPIRSYVAPFKGLKGGRNSASVTYHRSNFFQDDLDDPELAFDNNNTFRDDCITPLLLSPPTPQSYQ